MSHADPTNEDEWRKHNRTLEKYRAADQRRAAGSLEYETTAGDETLSQSHDMDVDESGVMVPSKPTKQQTPSSRGSRPPTPSSRQSTSGKTVKAITHSSSGQNNLTATNRNQASGKTG